MAATPLINKLSNMHQRLTGYVEAYPTADRPLQQQMAQQTKEAQTELMNLQDEMVQIISSDADDNTISQITQLYTEINGLVQKIPKDPIALSSVSGQYGSSPQRVNTSREDALLPPRHSAPMTQNLNENVRNLREQLQNIHKLLNQTQDATEITYEEEQDRLASADISVMAVNQLKATTKVQNQQLTLEVAQLQRQLAETQATNVDLKQRLVDVSHEAENLAEENRSYKQNLGSVTEAYKSLSTDFNTLKEEKMAVSSKYDVLRQAADMDRARFANEQRQHSQQISELETENAALIENNNRMKRRITELEQCDVESAALEVQRAAKTVQALNDVIEDLKTKLMKQKQHHNEVVNSLRTTIAALQEELFGDDVVDSQERLPRARLEEKVQELVRQNEDLGSQLQVAQQQSLRASEVRGNLGPANQGPQSMLDTINLLGGSRAQPRSKDNADDLLNIIQQSKAKK